MSKHESGTIGQEVTVQRGIQAGRSAFGSAVRIFLQGGCEGCKRQRTNAKMLLVRFSHRSRDYGSSVLALLVLDSSPPVGCRRSSVFIGEDATAIAVRRRPRGRHIRCSHLRLCEQCPSLGRTARFGVSS